MSELINISSEELNNLRERVKTLAREKSYLQLVNNLMNSLGAATSPENSAIMIVRLLLDNLGGSNVALYYRMANRIYYTDIYGGISIVDSIEDPMVRKVFESQQFAEEIHDFSETKMLTPAFTKSSQWALPLLVGKELIGALKTEGMLMGSAEILVQLQPFLNYAALILKNEIANHLELSAAKQLAAIVRSSANAIIGKTLDGVITSWNRGAEKIYGYTSQEMIGSHISELVPHEKKSEVTEILARCREGQSIDSLETVRKKKDGHLIHISVSISPIRNDSGKVVGISAISHDITERKKSEELLRQSEEQHRTIIQTAIDGFCRVDFQGKLLEVNEAYCRMSGYSISELLSMNISDIEAKETPSETAQHMENLLVKGEDRFETWHRRKNGSLFPVEVSVQSKIIEKGYIVAFFRDITERRRAEQQIKESYHLLNSVLNAIPDPIWLKDKESRFKVANQAWLAFFNRSLEDTLSRKTEDLFPKNIAPKLLKEDQQVITSGKTLKHLELMKNHKGDDRWFETIKSPLIDSAGQVIGIVGNARDITERLQAEQALQNSEERLRLAMDGAKMGAWERDLESNRLYWSASMEKINGYQPGTFPGTNDSFFEMLLPDCIEEHAAAYKRVREGDGVFQAELHLRLRDGRERWGLVLGQLLRDDRGKPKRIVGIDMDITERKRLEAQLRQAQKLEAVGQLAGGVAHDFNNILAAVMIHLNLLQQNVSLDSEIQEILKELLTEAQRATSLTRQLLLFSRHSVMEVKDLDLNELVANLLKMLGRLIGEHILVRFDRHDNLPTIKADLGMIEQVLMNLAVNARDAMPKGGMLTIDIAAIQAGPDRIKANPGVAPGLFVCLSVSDNGCGMDAATLQKIFEPFFTTKEPGKGTGLGLATVYGIVTQHKGWIEVESKPGKGSTFRVFLPATERQPPQQEVTKEPEYLRGTETILLVEDEKNLRQALIRGLSLLGYKVFAAANGPDALQLWELHSREIKLLLSDMVMPGGMNGLDLAEELTKQNSNLKIIISSGYNKEAAGQPFPTRENITFMQKPYLFEVLSKQIRECLDQVKNHS